MQQSPSSVLKSYTAKHSKQVSYFIKYIPDWVLHNPFSICFMVSWEKVTYWQNGLLRTNKSKLIKKCYIYRVAISKVGNTWPTGPLDSACAHSGGLSSKEWHWGQEATSSAHATATSLQLLPLACWRELHQHGGWGRGRKKAVFLPPKCHGSHPGHTGLKPSCSSPWLENSCQPLS